MTKRDRNSGKCVRTTAKLIADNVESPDTRLDTLLWPESGFPSYSWCYGRNGEAKRIAQRGNGSIRLVYPIPKRMKSPEFKLPGRYPRVGDPYFPHAVTDREGMAKDERAYLASIGWFGYR